MISFIIKGLFRDRSRSLQPFLVVTFVVSIFIFFTGFIIGIYDSIFLNTAVLNSGHLKVVTSAYQKDHQLLPNDLAILDYELLSSELENQYTDYDWTPRITFGGLIDVPDNEGNSLAQSPIIGFGIDFLSAASNQADLWQIDSKIVNGKHIEDLEQIIISETLAKKLNVSVGDAVTFLGSTMHGGLANENLYVTGIFNLNLGPVDRNMIITDFKTAQFILDMDNCSSEILGYQKNLLFSDSETVNIASAFNDSLKDSTDEYKPYMLALREASQLGSFVDFINLTNFIMFAIVFVVVSLLLWNMGIMNGLRRYGEFGLRLAIGESKKHVFNSMLIESLIIGFLGSLLGTILGLLVTYYLQSTGIDYSKALDTLSTSQYAMPGIFYPKVVFELYYIGFIPGILATLVGTILAARNIYKREMAQLFKELEE